MKKSIIFLIAIIISSASFAQKVKSNAVVKQTGTVLTNQYSCSMHPEITSNKAGKCSICGADLLLSKKEIFKMKEAGTYACPMHPGVVADKAGKCPKCGMSLVKANPADTSVKSKIHSMKHTM